jgi:hypothetical protein
MGGPHERRLETGDQSAGSGRDRDSQSPVKSLQK